MIARLNCSTDEAVRRFRERDRRPYWPLRLASVDGEKAAEPSKREWR
jgi:hypothetical protein